jgi:hypothetical protein
MEERVAASCLPGNGRPWLAASSSWFWLGGTASRLAKMARDSDLPAIQQYYESNSTKPKKCLPYLVVSAGRDSFLIV